MISCGTKSPPPGMYQMRLGCPLSGKGDNHRLEALIMWQVSLPGTSMRDGPSVVALVTRAAGDDQQAWDELVERCALLVWPLRTG
jgi:hypothetical protein